MTITHTLRHPIRAIEINYPSGWDRLLGTPNGQSTVKKVQYTFNLDDPKRITGYDVLREQLNYHGYTPGKGKRIPAESFLRSTPGLSHLNPLVDRPGLIHKKVREVMIQQGAIIIAWRDVCINRHGHIRIPVLEFMLEDLPQITWYRPDSPLKEIEVSLLG